LIANGRRGERLPAVAVLALFLRGAEALVLLAVRLELLDVEDTVLRQIDGGQSVGGPPRGTFGLHPRIERGVLLSNVLVQSDLLSGEGSGSIAIHHSNTLPHSRKNERTESYVSR